MNPNDPSQNPAETTSPNPSQNPNPIILQASPNTLSPNAPNTALHPHPSFPQTTPYAAGSYSSNGSSRKKPLLIIAPIVLLLLVIGGVAALFSAKHHDDKSTRSVSASTSYGTGSTTPEAQKTPQSNPVKTPLDKQIVTDYGYSITANELVTGYVPKYPESTVDTVMFKLTIAEQTAPQYTGTSPQSVDFVLVVDGQEVKPSQYYTGASDKELTDAGYPTLAIQTPTAGVPNSGYIHFGVPKGKKPTILRYKQKEAKVLGSSSTLPAKDYDIAL